MVKRGWLIFVANFSGTMISWAGTEGRRDRHARRAARVFLLKHDSFGLLILYK